MLEKNNNKLDITTVPCYNTCMLISKLEIMMMFVDKCKDGLIKMAVKATASKLQNMNMRTPISTTTAIADNIYVEFSQARQERFFVFHIDIEGCIIERQLVSVGTIDSTQVYIREIARQAVLNDTDGLILAHTHIANDFTPSDEDIGVTDKIVNAMATLGITVYDHIIVSKVGHYSFRDDSEYFDEETV